MDLQAMGSVASVISLFVLLATLGVAHRQAVEHLRAHIELLRPWANGHEGHGWTEQSITPADRLSWMLPGWGIVPNFSGSGISALTLLQNVAVHPELTPALVRVAQSVQTLNVLIERHEAFKVSMPELHLTVQGKIANAIGQVCGDRNRIPPDLTEEQVSEILRLSQLSEVENWYSQTLLATLRGLHLTFIGDARGIGLHRHLAELSQKVEKFHPR